MNPEHNHRENILLEALKLHDAGVPREEILARFPAETEELAALFDTAAAFEREGTSVTPEPQILERILETLPEKEQMHAEGGLWTRWWRQWTRMPIFGFGLALLIVAVGVTAAVLRQTGTGRNAAESELARGTNLANFDKETNELDQLATNEGLTNLDEELGTLTNATTGGAANTAPSAEPGPSESAPSAVNVSPSLETADTIVNFASFDETTKDLETALASLDRTSDTFDGLATDASLATIDEELSSLLAS